MDGKWICTTEEQKAKICDKQRKVLWNKAAMTMIRVAILGFLCLVMLLLRQHEEMDWAGRDILGFSPSYPPNNYFGPGMSREEQAEWRANQQEKIAQAYAVVRPQVFRKMLPYYILWLLAVSGTIGGRFLLNYRAEKRFEKNRLYFCKMRVVGIETCHTHYRFSCRRSVRLMLKDRNGRILRDVPTDCPYEIEPDTEVLLITTGDSTKEYEAVYPAEILRWTEGF